MAKASTAATENGGESIAGYFRRIFEARPRLLSKRSNKVVLEQWLADHPGAIEVPEKVKVNLANVKSVMRSKKRKRRKAAAAETGAAPAAVLVKKVKPSALETLEEQIDDCLTAAKTADKTGLSDVIGLLRRARNTVVWKLGQ